MNRHPRLLLLLPLAALASCSSIKQEVVVSVPDQQMALYYEDQLLKTYPISTSKYGLGDQPGSYRTPVGTMAVAKKIGHGAPHGAVFKSRRRTGEVLPPNAPGRDPIVTRILWLKGKSHSTQSAYGRYIYIHGTPEERNLGKPCSYGCIRMASRDIAQLFELVPVGTPVIVTTQRLAIVHQIKTKADKEKPAVAMAPPGDSRHLTAPTFPLPSAPQAP